MPRSKSLAAAAALAFLALLTLAAAAYATQPGKNGKIAFRRYLTTDGTWGAVFTIDPTGKHERQVTHPPKGSVDDQPAWAPDGSLLTFSRCADNAPCLVYVVAPDGGGLTRLSAACPSNSGCVDDAHPSFSPDSSRIAFVQATGTVKTDPQHADEQWIEHSAIAVMNRDGTGRQVIYQRDPFSGDLDFPVFSPNGKRIVFEWHASGFTSHAGHQAIFVMGADGTNVRQLTPWAENDGDNPEWSPDGKWIVYHSHNDQPVQSQVFVVRPDGTGRKQLTHIRSDGTFVGSAAFSPDGKQIVFGLGPAGRNNVDVYVMRRDGSHLTRVTHSPLWDSAPDWGPAPAHS